MTTWYPMETAPRDGTRILVWNEEIEHFQGKIYDSSCVMLVMWEEEDGGVWGAKKVWAVPGSWQDEQGGYHTADNPKGWMHVPEWTGVE